MLKSLKSIINNSDINEIIKKASFFILFRAIAFLLAYLFALIVVKHYSVDVYGYVTLSFTTIMIVSVVGRFGFDVILTRLFSINNNYENSNNYKIASLFAFVLTLFLALLLFGFSDQISNRVFSKPEFSQYLKWTSFCIPLWTILLINIGIFRGLKKVFLYATLDNFGRFFLTIIILYGIIRFGVKSNYAPIISHFFALLILTFISLAFVFSLIETRTKVDFRKAKSLVKSAYPIMLSSSIIIFLSWFDKILLGIMGSEKDVGVYDVSVRIATLLTFNLEAINAILAPKVSKFYHESNIKELNKIVQFSSKINVIISGFIFLIIVLFGSFILKFFGEEFLLGGTTLIILCVGQFFNSFCGPVGNILHMTGFQKDFRNIMGLALFVNITLDLILIKPYGINGAAIASTISLIIWNVFGVIMIRKKLKINSFYFPKIW